MATITSIYTITHKCGHSAERKLTGVVNNDLEMKADYWQKCLCPACYAAKVASKSESSILPALQGSEKQVAWAMTLRNQIIIRADKYIADFTKRQGNALLVQMQSDRTKMIARTEAKFWIENRNGLEALQNA